MVPAQSLRPGVTIAVMIAAVILAHVDSLPAKDAVSKQVAMLVERLGSMNYRHREDAQRGLLAIGPAAIGPLRAAVDDPDLEVSLRARQLLQGLECRTMWSGTVIRFPSVPVRASDLLDAIERQSAARVGLHELVHKAGDPQIATQQLEIEFWPAVERVAAHLNAAALWQFNTCGNSSLVLRTDINRLAVAYQGALRCEVVSCKPCPTSSREDERAVRTVELTLRLSWEPKLDVISVQSQPRLCWSTAFGRSSDARFSTNSGQWQQTAGNLPCCTVTVPLAVDAERSGLPRLESIAWGLIALGPGGVHDRRTVQFDFEAISLPLSTSRPHVPADPLEARREL